MPGFADVKLILKAAAANAAVGVVNLQIKHADASFPDLYGDFTNAQLQAAVARGRRLIDPALVPAPGTIGKRGAEANLVLALQGLIAGVRQMPGGGPPVSDADIATVVAWINSGCPD